MNFARHCPLLLCADLTAASDFYRAQLKLELTLDLDWFVGLQRPEGQGPRFELSLAQAGHPSLDLPTAMAGPTRGLILAFEVENADAECERFRSRGAEVVRAPVDHPWGQRNFYVSAPDGVTLDMFQITTPDPAWLRANGLG